MKNLLELLQGGAVPSKETSIELAEMMEDFVKTDVYKIILLFNSNEIKQLLTIPKSPGESSDQRLGRMEGIQQGFENRVYEIIRAGNMVLEEKKKVKKYKKELESDPDQDTDKE